DPSTYLSIVKDHLEPISVQTGVDAGQAFKQGNVSQGVGDILSLAGTKVSQPSAYQQRDAAIAAAGLKQADGSPVKGWADMSPTQQRAWKSNLSNPQYTSTNPAAVASAKAQAHISTQAATQQAGLDKAFPQGGTQWRDGYHQIQ